MRNTLLRYAVIALSIVGSATLLFSCGGESNTTHYDYEALMTERSENRTITMTENGERAYSFYAPLIEGYSLAQNPYQEFREGINMTTYTSDSLSLVDATIKANYAIYYDKQKLWEAKGDVVIIKKNRKEGDTIVKSLTEVYTQQLFWDARTKKIYSNVDTKVLQDDGWHFGVGFEADEDLKNIHFRKYKSEMEFDFTPVEETPEEAAARKEKETAKKRETAKKGSSTQVGKRPNRPTTQPSDRSNINPSASSKNSKKQSSAKSPTRPQNTPPKRPQGNVKPNSNLSTGVSSEVNRPQRPTNGGGNSSTPKGGVTRPAQTSVTSKQNTKNNATSNGAKSIRRDAPRSILQNLSSDLYYIIVWKPL